jgi:hypothetical protein
VSSIYNYLLNSQTVQAATPVLLGEGFLMRSISFILSYKVQLDLSTDSPKQTAAWRGDSEQLSPFQLKAVQFRSDQEALGWAEKDSAVRSCRLEERPFRPK